VATPCRSIGARLESTRAWVLETSGEGFSVQLMNSARNPAKFHSESGMPVWSREICARYTRAMR
jgi:hypothetical protein